MGLWQNGIAPPWHGAFLRVRIPSVSTNLFGLLVARALNRQIGMGCGFQIPTTWLSTPSISDGTVKLPGLGSKRGWFESSAVHYGSLVQW